MGNIINICFITDNNYFVPTLTSIMSLVKNFKQHQLSINIICNNVNHKNVEFAKTLEFENVKINILKIENPYLELGEKHIHVSKAALLKFSIAQIFSELDKILYIDSDVLIFKDLIQLYETDIDNYYAAVVSDMKAVKEYQFHKKFGLKNYFNSGVMLLNLKKNKRRQYQRKTNRTKKTRKMPSIYGSRCLKSRLQ